MLEICFVYAIFTMLNLKSFILFIQIKGNNVGFTSVFSEDVLFALVNKGTALAYSRAEYNQAGRNREIRKIQIDTM